MWGSNATVTHWEWWRWWTAQGGNCSITQRVIKHGVLENHPAIARWFFPHKPPLIDDFPIEIFVYRWFAQLSLHLARGFSLVFHVYPWHSHEKLHIWRLHFLASQPWSSWYRCGFPAPAGAQRPARSGRAEAGGERFPVVSMGSESRRLGFRTRTEIDR